MQDRLSFQGSLQFGWDSTSLTTFKECPRKYQYSILLGYTPRAENVHFKFGIFYHRGLELYDHFRISWGHDEAQFMMVHDMMQETWGWHSDGKYKNRQTLIRSLVWYTEQFKNDPAQTIILANGKPAVELSFRFELPIVQPDGSPYLYSGHMDRVAEWQGSTYVFDRKTSKSAIYDDFFAKFNPHNQMSGYTFAGKVVFAQPIKGIVIDAAQVAVGFTKFERGFTFRTDDQLDEWVDTTSHYIKLAEGYAKADFWPMNEASCHNYGGCPFRPICSKPARLRLQWLEADYAKRLWDPLQIRGDI